MKSKIIKPTTILFLFLNIWINISAQESGFTDTTSENGKDQDYYFAFTEATKFYLFGKYSQAINLYRECLKIKPNSSAIHYQIAKIFIATNNTDLAIDHAKKACEFSNENKWYLQELADIYQVGQKFDSAILVYKKLRSLDKDNINSIFTIAGLYEQIGKPDEALHYLDIIDKEIGPSKEVSISRFRILSKKKLDKDALEQLKQAYSLSDNEYSLNGLIAEFFRNLNEPDSAYVYYKKI